MMDARSEIEFTKTVNTSRGVALLVEGNLLEITSSLPREKQDEIVIALAGAARLSARPRSVIGGVMLGGTAETAEAPRETAITQDVE